MNLQNYSLTKVSLQNYTTHSLAKVSLQNYKKTTNSLTKVITHNYKLPDKEQNTDTSGKHSQKGEHAELQSHKGEPTELHII